MQIKDKTSSSVKSSGLWLCCSLIPSMGSTKGRELLMPEGDSPGLPATFIPLLPQNSSTLHGGQPTHH